MNEQWMISAQQYLARTRGVNDDKWRSLMAKVFPSIIGNLTENNIDDACKKLSSFGFSSEQVLRAVYRNTFDDKIRRAVIRELFNARKLTDDEEEFSQKLDTTFIVLAAGNNADIQLNAKSLELLGSEYGRLLLPGLFLNDGDEQHRERCYEYVSPQLAWSSLLMNNEEDLLQAWIRNSCNANASSPSSSSPFPLNWPISQEMTDMFTNANELTAEHLLISLSGNGIFHSQEGASPNLMLGRLFALSADAPRTNLFENHDDHPLSAPTASIQVDGFLKQIAEYAAANELYDFLLWFTSASPNNRSVLAQCDSINAGLRQLLTFYATNAAIDVDDDTFGEHLALAIARYIVQSADEFSLERLAIAESSGLQQMKEIMLYCSQFISNDNLRRTSEQNEFINSFANALKDHYPIVSQSLLQLTTPASAASPSPTSLSSPTVYELLKQATYFDMSRMFCWQSTNGLRTTAVNHLRDLPHFSHPQLTGLHGLKANLNFMYYIREGRPVEAYLQRIADTSSAKRLESACNRAALVAFFHCSRPEVASSAVIFQELLKNDSLTLRLHLAVANLILSHAQNYLALTMAAQVTTLGSLLKKSLYQTDKQAPNRLLQLLVTALGKKYEYNKECLVEEVLEWQVAIRFAQLYSLELPSEFLIKCAQHDDWLLFIMFSQMYDYPKEIVLPLLQSFNNGCIADHMEKAFKSSNFKVDNDNSPVSILKGRRSNVSATHSRNTLYSRIGLRQQIGHSQHDQRPIRTSPPQQFETDELKSIASETDITNLETLSIASRSSTETFESLFLASNPPKDFFSLLVLCQKACPIDIWKALLISSVVFNNPSLSLLATSLLPAQSTSTVFDCFCCWLTSSFVGNVRIEVPDEPRYINWSESEFVDLLKIAFKIPKNYRIFLTGLKLFHYEKNPVVPLVEFLVDFHLEKEYYKSAQSIKTFQEKLWALPSNEDDEEHPSWGKDLIEQVSVVLFETGLENTATTYELRIMLRHLDFARAQSSFSTDVKVPDFRKLYRLCKCLIETDLEISVLEFLYVDEESDYYAELAQRITYSLQERRYFNEAIQFATIACINLDAVVINEWRVKASTRSESINIQFWNECLSSIEKANIELVTIIHFVTASIEESNSVLVRVFLLAKKCIYLIQCAANKEQLYECETKLWADIILIESESFSKQSDHLELIWQTIAKLSNEDFIPAEQFTAKLQTNFLTPDQTPILDRLIGRLIANGNIRTAYRVAELFSYYHKELALVELGTTLANGNLPQDTLVAQLDESIEELHLAALISEGIQSNKEKVIEVLEHICNFTDYAKTACLRMLLLFKASCLLSMKYSELENSEDDLNVIKKLITIGNPSSGAEAIMLAKEIITVNNISNETAAEIVCQEIVQNIRLYTYKSLKENMTSDANNRFLTLLRILNDPSYLGKKLLDVIKENAEEFSQRTIAEFYIKAHDCFNTCSDIEGIAVVLRNVKCFVIQQLAANSDYHSMMRLLTGIGRYSEMTYIFDILRDNHEFEVLLGKGIEKNPQLRIAILDSLKGDKEMYPMVALNFSMHREIAEMLESDAMRIIKNIQIRQHNMNSFKEMLERSLHDIVDASESYAKASCYNHSTRCAKLAELIALQVSYLHGGPILINLNHEQVSEFIAQHHNFPEALIVAEAYNHNDSWSLALYRNVVERGDFVYLREFLSHIQLTSNHLEDVVNKYLQVKLRDQTQDAAAAISLQKLLNHSNDAKVKLRLLRSLGFTSMAKQFLADDNNVYFRDVITQ